MATRECNSCNGRGTKRVPRRRVVKDKDGKSKTITETVAEDCKACRGSGVIPR